MSTSDHVPVLARETVELLAPEPGDIVIDCTMGAGGHARLLGERLGTSGELVCVDRDPAAARRHEMLAERLECRSRFIEGDFADVLERLASEGMRADAVLFDFGISSLQMDDPARGFSYSHDGPLDMRMAPDAELTAETIVNEWPEQRITTILRSYGEERQARAIAAEIAASRPLRTTGELAEAVRRAVSPKRRFGAGHPARLTFQAIRIAVNGELEAIDRALPLAWEMLREGGRIATIAFHSLEDRRAKRFLADRATGCICPPELPVCVCGREPEAELLTRGAVKPSPDEVAPNPRARSARLRGARRLAAKETTG